MCRSLVFKPFYLSILLFCTFYCSLLCVLLQSSLRCTAVFSMLYCSLLCVVLQSSLRCTAVFSTLYCSPRIVFFARTGTDRTIKAFCFNGKLMTAVCCMPFVRAATLRRGVLQMMWPLPSPAKARPLGGEFGEDEAFWAGNFLAPLGPSPARFIG